MLGQRYELHGLLSRNNLEKVLEASKEIMHFQEKYV